MGFEIYQAVIKFVNNDDPFKKMKEESNRLAMLIAEDLIPELKDASDKLLIAVKLAIIGNIIDYGAITGFRLENLENEIKTYLHNNLAVSNYKQFKVKLETAKFLLYLGDNAGEIVFDKILIEEM